MVGSKARSRRESVRPRTMKPPKNRAADRASSRPAAARLFESGVRLMVTSVSKTSGGSLHGDC